MSGRSQRAILMRMRAEVVYHAELCECWAGKARAEEDARRPGAAICLASVARGHSEAAFTAVANAQAQLRAGGAT